MELRCEECKTRLRVRDDIERDRIRCPKCKSLVDVPQWDDDYGDYPEADEILAPSIPLRVLYWMAILFSVGFAVYLYFVAFDDLSEERLIALSGVWIYPLVFGVYGLIAQTLLRLIDEDKADNIWAAAVVWAHMFGLVGVVLLLPFALLKGSRNSLVIAVLGSAFWVALLAIFFAAIFPML